MSYKNILSKQSKGITTITINRPSKLNALNKDTIQELHDAFDEADCDVGFEIHPGEDIFDGTTFEMFLERVDNHPRCQINYDPSHFLLQQLDYIDFIDIYHERICAFHVKDAEFNPTGRQGVYSGYAPWIDRAARFRSLGDGQVDGIDGGVFLASPGEFNSHFGTNAMCRYCAFDSVCVRNRDEQANAKSADPAASIRFGLLPPEPDESDEEQQQTSTPGGPQ